MSNENNCKTREIFIKNIINLRGSKSVYEVSKETGISYTYLSKLEKGKTNTPSFETLEKLAAYYNISVAELISEWE